MSPGTSRGLRLHVLDADWRRMPLFLLWHRGLVLCTHPTDCPQSSRQAHRTKSCRQLVLERTIGIARLHEKSCWKCGRGAKKRQLLRNGSRSCLLEICWARPRRWGFMSTVLAVPLRCCTAVGCLGYNRTGAYRGAWSSSGASSFAGARQRMKDKRRAATPRAP